MPRHQEALTTHVLKTLATGSVDDRRRHLLGSFKTDCDAGGKNAEMMFTIFLFLYLDKVEQVWSKHPSK